MTATHFGNQNESVGSANLGLNWSRCLMPISMSVFRPVSIFEFGWQVLAWPEDWIGAIQMETHPLADECCRAFAGEN